MSATDWQYWEYSGSPSPDIRYAMWKSSPEWIVIAQERLGNEPVVSVQFKPDQKKHPKPKPTPSTLTTTARELELA